MYLTNGSDGGSSVRVKPVNIAQRHLNKGQIAVVVAKAYPEAEHGGARKKGSSLETKLAFPMVSAFALSQARTIVRYAPELADRVVELEGMRFSDAFEHETRARRSGRRKTSIIGGGSGETLRARSDVLVVKIKRLVPP